MRILHCVLISISLLVLAFAILLKNNFHSDSSNPLPNSPPLNYLMSAPRAPTPPPPPPPPPPQVTSYILALQWPHGVCSSETRINCQINPVPTEFKIHGLWPEPNGAPSTETYDVQKIAGALADKLGKNWPNLESKQQSISVNIKFWQHEWTDHGIYSGFGVRDYYEKSLELFGADGQGLTAKLAAKQIIPNNYKPYKLVDIEDAVKKINGGFSGTIRCVERHGSSKQQQIQEIRFRYKMNFDKDNNWSPSNCGTDILFPGPP